MKLNSKSQHWNFTLLKKDGIIPGTSIPRPLSTKNISPRSERQVGVGVGGRYCKYERGKRTVHSGFFSFRTQKTEHRARMVPRPAQQSGLNFLIKGIQFLTSIPGGSETSVECTNLGIGCDGLGQMYTFGTGAKEEQYVGTRREV